MKYYSTKNRALRTDLKETVFKGLAPDGGLFMPENIPQVSEEFLVKLIKDELSFQEISLYLSNLFFGEDLPYNELESLVFDAINFETPLEPVGKNLYSLELFHGPTLAFKDVGARFMARMLRALIRNHDRQIHVLVATSGDTGSAVANGFLGVDGIHVHVLYPKNRVSKIQEIQFTTLGENISALEVDGSFDDCQKLVKQAFNEASIRKNLSLTSANSINLARLLPQAFYYFNAYRQLAENEELVFCVPSGNFGNLTAGLIANRMGLPVKHFITSTNLNRIVPEYLETGQFSPQPSLTTLANAMDVGNPSNFDRMLDLFEHSHEKMSKSISGYSFNDHHIREGILKCFKTSGYLLDPHGSTGYLASEEYLKKFPDDRVIFLETAHPVKFRDTVEKVTSEEIKVPERLAKFFEKKKKSIPVGNGFNEFKEYLMALRD